ncbi:chitin-inducible gibberellin-responsive protein 1 [Striga asiatica]|uniref:Chitin-inducible gibberellin-responsive protein 1 n=1 Tax=Striga asiatica TaxID=4170 RepID=A0A5A7QSX5_STRAF|nr:chitin-inducible gibberellin-responsive protein 1 [Striga asiatica]
MSLKTSVEIFGSVMAEFGFVGDESPGFMLQFKSVETTDPTAEGMNRMRDTTMVGDVHYSYESKQPLKHVGRSQLCQSSVNPLPYRFTSTWILVMALLVDNVKGNLSPSSHADDQPC